MWFSFHRLQLELHKHTVVYIRSRAGCYIAYYTSQCARVVVCCNTHMHLLTQAQVPTNPDKRAGQQQVPFYPEKNKKQNTKTATSWTKASTHTLTRWADIVSCCGGCLCSFSRNWTGTTNKVSALLCPSLTEQPCSSHWRLLLWSGSQ